MCLAGVIAATETLTTISVNRLDKNNKNNTSSLLRVSAAMPTPPLMGTREERKSKTGWRDASLLYRAAKRCFEYPAAPNSAQAKSLATLGFQFLNLAFVQHLQLSCLIIRSREQAPRDPRHRWSTPHVMVSNFRSDTSTPQVPSCNRDLFLTRGAAGLGVECH